MKSKKDKTNLGKKLSKKMKYKWIKALESGRYKQTTGELHNENSDTNCCLGVLCRVMGMKHETIKHGATLTEFEKLKDIISSDVETKLIQMNDTEGKSFTDIAAYLRKTKEV